MEIFKALNRRGRTIVTITHDTEIGSYPERAIQFRETKVLEDGGSKKTRLKKDRIW
jgi:ABC-type lipoprotein export system ATPase subunit